MVAVKHINTLSYGWLKKMHIACEADIKFIEKSHDDEFLPGRKIELALIEKRIGLLKENVDNFQFDKLQGFFSYCWHKEHNPEPHRDYHKDNAFWAENLDNAGVPWVIQNQVAYLSDKRENGPLFKNLETLLAQSGIKVVSDLSQVTTLSQNDVFDVIKTLPAGFTQTNIYSPDQYIVVDSSASAYSSVAEYLAAFETKDVDSETIKREVESLGAVKANICETL
ncbi:MAG: hypothetical protein A3F91_09530 [Flavobacteria bacterium RIFCSPLOWO2_12_FULL_35_11]|nr:MAG: hypothetical protein A3F91_09530 [Flavobacteria bacterium RIFCSPLOWO2_12_FULL_35_11]